MPAARRQAKRPFADVNRIGAFDRCGCMEAVDESAMPEHIRAEIGANWRDYLFMPRTYATCPLHGETPYDRGARGAVCELYEKIRTAAVIVGFFALVGLMAGFAPHNTDATQSVPVAEAIYDAAGQAALRAVLWTILASCAIVFVIILVAEWREKPRYRP